MNKQEALTKIEELKKFVAELDNQSIGGLRYEDAEYLDLNGGKFIKFSTDYNIKSFKDYTDNLQEIKSYNFGHFDYTMFMSKSPYNHTIIWRQKKQKI